MEAVIRLENESQADTMKTSSYQSDKAEITLQYTTYIQETL